MDNVNIKFNISKNKHKYNIIILKIKQYKMTSIPPNTNRI